MARAWARCGGCCGDDFTSPDGGFVPPGGGFVPPGGGFVPSGGGFTPASSVIRYDFRRPESIFTKPAGSQAGFDAWLGVSGTTLESLYLFDDATTTCVDALGNHDLTHGSAVMLQRTVPGLWNGTDMMSVIGVEYPNFSANSSTTAPDASVFDFGTDNFGGFVVWEGNSVTGIIASIVGKATNGTSPGWYLQISATGVPQLTIRDNLGNQVAQTLTSVHASTGRHYLVWWIDRTNNLMRLYSDLDKPAAVSIAAVTGSLSTAEFFTWGRGRFNTFSYASRHLVGGIFNSVAQLDNTTAWDNLWGRITTRRLPNLTYTRAAAFGTNIGADASGIAMTMNSAGEVGYGWRSNFTHATKLGLQLAPPVTNLFVRGDTNNTTSWTIGGGLVRLNCIGANPATLSANNDDPRRCRWAPTLTKAGAGDNLRQTATLTNGSYYGFSVYLKVADVTNVPRLVILDGGGVTVATLVCAGMVAGEWARFFLVYQAAATAVHTFEIHPSDPAAATGECWAQYGQLELTAVGAAFPTPYLFSVGTAFLSVNTQALSTQPVLNTAEGRFDVTWVFDTRTTSTQSLVGGLTLANWRVLAQSLNTDNVSIQGRDSATAIFYSLVAACTPGNENRALFAWRGSGPTRARGDINGTTSVSAGTFTGTGRQTLAIGQGLVTSTNAVVATVEIRERFAA